MSARDSILITGGAGFVGGHIARAARDSGSRVVVLDDLSSSTAPPEGVAFVRGDIADRKLVRHVIREYRVTSCAHLAGKSRIGESIAHPAMYFDRNLVRTLALLDELLAHSIPFLYSSSAAVYGSAGGDSIPESARLEPLSPYGDSKMAVERALGAYGTAYGLPWAALRYFNAAGAHPDGTIRERHDPEFHLIPLAVDAALGRGPPLMVFGADYPTRDGTCIRDYIHVSDLARAHLAVLDALDAGTPVGALNLGSGTGVTVREVLGEAARVLGRPVPHEIGPRRAGDPTSLLANADRAAALLGWRPERSDIATILDDAVRSRS